jgi:BMFP domain-containing protein YqiC
LADNAVNRTKNDGSLVRTLAGEYAVVDPKIIDDLARRLAESMPDSLRALQQDVDQNFRAILQAGLGRMDLVTREEFDVQQGVLRRTREKLKDLESRLAALESGGSEDLPAD